MKIIDDTNSEDNNKYINNNMDMDKHPGRPTGFRVTIETKNKIRKSRVGTSHSEETKNKISKSLSKYFREKDPLSKSLQYEYKEFPDKACKWIVDNENNLDKTEDVLTEKRLFFIDQLELQYGFEINNFSHNTTPEFLILLKEELIEKGLTEELEELYNLII